MRPGRRADRPPVPPRRRWFRALLVLVVVASLVAVAVSVRQLLDLEDRKEVADAAVVDARRGEAELDAQAADLEARIDRLELARDAHLSTA